LFNKNNTECSKKKCCQITFVHIQIYECDEQANKALSSRVKVEKCFERFRFTGRVKAENAERKTGQRKAL